LHEGLPNLRLEGFNWLWKSTFSQQGKRKFSLPQLKSADQDKRQQAHDSASCFIADHSVFCGFAGSFQAL